MEDSRRMKKIIIRNLEPDKISDLDATHLVLSVIKQGKISNDGTEYCYHTGFGVSETDTKYEVSCYTHKSGTSTFYVRTEEWRIVGE